MSKNFGTLNFSTSFKPTSAFPTNANEYFETLAEAEAAAAEAEEAGSSNTVYYYGQILVVYEDGKVSAYQIQPDNTLLRIDSATDIAELEEKISNESSDVKQSISDIEDGTTIVGAAHKIRSNLVCSLNTSSDVGGWYKISSLSADELHGSAAYGGACSLILQVNGINDAGSTDSSSLVAKSGTIEIDTYVQSSDGIYTISTVARYSQPKILSGNLQPNEIAVYINENDATLDIYFYFYNAYTRMAFTVLSEQFSSRTENLDAFQNGFLSYPTFYNTDNPPDGSIYAVRANESSTADKVTNKLTFSVNGEEIEYDGSEAKTVEIEITTATDNEAVHFTEQSLTDTQKKQARTNIGAAAVDDVTEITDDIKAIQYGTTTVGKATADASGNTITSFYGHNLTFEMDSSTFVLTVTLLNAAGTTLATQSVDLPLESVVVNGSYDENNQTIILTLQNGNTVSVPVGDLVAGLATQTALDKEVAARQTADTTLKESISAEASTRETANAALEKRISAIETGTYTFDDDSFSVSDDNEVSLKPATKTTYGGVRIYLDEDGALHIDTEEV